MEINFSKKQYLDLVKAVETADMIYGLIGDYIPDDYQAESHNISKLQEYLLKLAPAFGCGEIMEEFRGSAIMSEEFSEGIDAAMVDYDEITFCNELEMRLGKRDFARTVTKEELQQMERDHGFYPERIHALYEKWGREIEEHGVNRLEVDYAAKVVSEIEELEGGSEGFVMKIG